MEKPLTLSIFEGMCQKKCIGHTLGFNPDPGMAVSQLSLRALTPLTGKALENTVNG